MASEQQLPLELQEWSIAKSGPTFCRILCLTASITTVFLNGDVDRA